MTVQFDSASSTYSGSTPSKTLSVTVADNPDRVLYIAVLVGTNNRSVASVARDGQSASLVYLGEYASDVQVEIWRIIAPNVGTANVTVTFDASSETVIGSLSLYGAHQSAPDGGFVDYEGGSFTTHALDVTPSSVDDLVVDVLGVSSGGKITSTPGAGQTQRVSNNDFTWRSFFISTKQGAAGNVTMQQTTSATIASGAVYVAFAVAAAGGGGPAPTAPSGATASSVTNSSATINWTDNSSDETGFKVEYGVSSGGTVASWSAASGSPTAADATSLALSGLTASTTYKARVAATNANGDSAWAETAEFTTTAASVKGVSIQLGDGTPAANLTGLSVRWWDAEAPTGAPDYESDVETTDASGWLEIDLSAVTALAIGANGYLHVFKAGATPADDVVAAGRVPVSDIA